MTTEILAHMGRDQLEQLIERERAVHKHVLDNLTATQGRCTELLQSLRALKRTPDSMSVVLGAIVQERERQEELSKSGRFEKTCANLTMPALHKLGVLSEEHGEVAHVVMDAVEAKVEPDLAKLRSELTQVAAVCVAWLESLQP